MRGQSARGWSQESNNTQRAPRALCSIVVSYEIGYLWIAACARRCRDPRSQKTSAQHIVRHAEPVISSGLATRIMR